MRAIDNFRMASGKARVSLKGKSSTIRASNHKSKSELAKPSRGRGKVVAVETSRWRTVEPKAEKIYAPPTKTGRSAIKVSKLSKPSSASVSNKATLGGKKPAERSLTLLNQSQSSMLWGSGGGLLPWSNHRGSTDVVYDF